MRGRAGVEMPPITETDPSILRERLRNERRIELAYEGIRYWDLLRWEIADKVLVGEVWEHLTLLLLLMLPLLRK